MSRKLGALGWLAFLMILVLWSDRAASNPTTAQTRGFRDFFVRMADGEEVDLASNGPIHLVARCGVGSPGMQILFTSDADGWYSNSAARNAGDEAVLCSGSSSGRFDQCEDGSALSSDGRYVGVSGDTSFGVAVLGSDCIVVGSATTTFDPGS